MQAHSPQSLQGWARSFFCTTSGICLDQCNPRSTPHISDFWIVSRLSCFRKIINFCKGGRGLRSDRIQTTGQQLRLVLMSTRQDHPEGVTLGDLLVLIALIAMERPSPTMASTFREQPRWDGCGQRMSILPSASWPSPLAFVLISQRCAAPDSFAHSWTGVSQLSSWNRNQRFFTKHPGFQYQIGTTVAPALWIEQLSPPPQMRGRHRGTTLIADAFRTKQLLGF